MRATLVALALALTGCAQTGVLVAENGDHRLRARDEASGVTVVLTTGVWDGAPSDLEQSFAVVHVLVANLGDEPILLAPGDWELRDGRGFLYELADPGATFHHVDDHAPAPETAYGRQYRRDYDPGGPVQFDPIFGEGDMAARALPWGVLLPKTQMRGFLYFEPVTRTANDGVLVWHVRRPDHTPVVDLRFALYVSRPRRG